MKRGRTFKIVILSDYSSWMKPTIELLILEWKNLGHEVFLAHSVKDLIPADFCFCLSFSKIIPVSVLQNFKHTLVVHESDLPAGKGWSPLTWQILEGKNRIPITLFEAAERVDSGVIYAQRWIQFEGNELIEELREGQAAGTRELCQLFLDEYPEIINSARTQVGRESFYSRRTPRDSELDPNKSISEQFNLLRVVDNNRYPAFFNLNGQRFRLQISKDEKTK